MGTAPQWLFTTSSCADSEVLGRRAAGSLSLQDRPPSFRTRLRMAEDPEASPASVSGPSQPQGTGEGRPGSPAGRGQHASRMQGSPEQEATQHEQRLSRDSQRSSGSVASPFASRQQQQNHWHGDWGSDSEREGEPDDA